MQTASLSHPLLKHLHSFFNKHLLLNCNNFVNDDKEITLLLGLSGGLDSIVLLDVLHRYKNEENFLAEDKKETMKQTGGVTPKIKELRALYVHHGLSPNADSWAEHCQMVCDKLGVQLIIERVQLVSKGIGIEAAARKARYEAFKKHLHKECILVTAQHLDDQAETFLLALKRGSGIRGLGSMAPYQQLDSGHWQLRPLLNFTRQELEIYANRENLTWINDESNFDDRFDRNFLRLNIMPTLLMRWPHFNQALATSAELCRNDTILLDELLFPLLLSVTDQTGNTLFIPPLKDWSQQKRQAIIKKWCEKKTLMAISREQLRRIWEEVALSREDATAVVEIGLSATKETVLEVRRYRDKLYIVERQRSTSFDQQLQEASQASFDISSAQPAAMLPWQVQPLNFLQITGFIRSQLQQKSRLFNSEKEYLQHLHTKTFTIKFNLASSIKINTTNKTHRQTLKQLWQQYHIPPWQRPFVPMIFDDKRLIGALDVFLVDLNSASPN